MQNRELSDDQIVALVLASFVLGNTTWPGAVKMLNVLSRGRKQIVIDTFKLGLQRRVSTDITEWICDNLALVEEQHY
jgi:hypothetical protein